MQHEIQTFTTEKIWSWYSLHPKIASKSRTKVIVQKSFFPTVEPMC